MRQHSSGEVESATFEPKISRLLGSYIYPTLECRVPPFRRIVIVMVLSGIDVHRDDSLYM